MRYVLIDIAIHEKQPDQVLRWYDMKPEDDVGGDRMDRVATAVMEYATDRSVGLWKKLAEWEISKSSPPPTKRRPVTCGSSRVCWSSRDGRRSGRPTSRDSGPAMQGSGAGGDLGNARRGAHREARAAVNAGSVRIRRPSRLIVQASGSSSTKSLGRKGTGSILSRHP